MANNEEIQATVQITGERGGSQLTRGVRVSGDAAELLRQAAESPRKVQLQRAETTPTPDQALWTAIRNRTGAIGFGPYRDFINRVLCPDDVAVQDVQGCGGTETAAQKLQSRWRGALPTQFHGADAYELLKVATEVFLILECGVFVRAEKDPATGGAAFNDTAPMADETSRLGFTLTYGEAKTKLTEYLGTRGLPYLDRIIRALFPGATTDDERAALETHPYCYDSLLMHRYSCPCLLELIWSFWHEEGMLVQTMNALSLRFQNKRAAREHDPLVHLNLDPLRPLSNFIWGYIQDEINRLSVARRVYEYDHHYGLTLVGKAVPTLRSADSRSKFLEAFHNLLHVTSRFYREDDDTTVIADAFPVLNALKEVHLVLAQGAHNQFGDLPWTARAEMLVQQWLLARPEIREFLSRPPMVPYKEDWMATVDVMKQLQGWSDVTVTHFRDLAVYGEQILLAIRYGDWIDVNDSQQARNWARYWRPEVQSYLHSYRAVTGVDLTAEVTDAQQAAERFVQPSVHHYRRLELQRGQRSRELTPTTGGGRDGAFTAPGRELPPR